MNQLVKKGHELVMGRFNLSILEWRLFCLIVSKIDDRDGEFKTYYVSIKELMQTFNLKSKSIYGEIQQITTAMLKKIIVIPVKENGVEKHIKTTLMSSFKYEVGTGRGVLECTFNPVLKPYLLNLKNRFLLYNLSNILQLSSTSAIRLYEILRTFLGVKTKTFSLQELKEMLGVENNYDKYSNFKAKILLKSQQQLLEHTDIKFEFKELSENSRRVQKIQFFIYPNTPKQQEVSKPTKPDLQREWAGWTSLEHQLLSLWISHVVLKDLLQQYEISYILQTLNYCQGQFKKTAVENKAGFFLSALQKGYYKKDIEIEQSKAKKKNQDKQQELFQRQSEQEKKVVQEEQLQKLRDQYMNDHFVTLVLGEYEWNFLHPIMKKDWEKGKINKFLQGFVDRKLKELYGDKKQE